MLQIEDFVRDALVQIANGVYSASDAVRGKAMFAEALEKTAYRTESIIHFDIAVAERDTASTAINGTAKGGIVVVGGSATVGHESEKEHKDLNRIQFDIKARFLAPPDTAV